MRWQRPLNPFHEIYPLETEQEFTGAEPAEGTERHLSGLILGPHGMPDLSTKQGGGCARAHTPPFAPVYAAQSGSVFRIGRSWQGEKPPA